MLERPNTQFAIYRSPTVGDNQAGGIGAMVLAGSRIRGVIVDNPSGSWVKLSGTGLGFEPFIAPFTLAWSVSLLPSVLEISAAYVTGPTGQPMSTAGSPIVVYLFEAQVPSSGGSSFVVPSSESITLSNALVAVAAPNHVDILAPMVGKKIRIVAMQAALDPTPPNLLDANAEVIWRSTDAATIAGTLVVGPHQPSFAVLLPVAVDLPAGVGATVDFISAWGRVPLNIYTTFEIV